MVTVKLFNGHVLDHLRKLPDDSIHCVVTSPPYWGLRDYGIEPVVWGGELGCGHEWGEEFTANQSGGGLAKGGNKTGGDKDYQLGERSQGSFCRLCSAWRGSYGLEPTIELYVQHTVQIFHEVRRVLQKGGVCFLNMGDSYNTNQGGNWGLNHRKGRQYTKEAKSPYQGYKSNSLKPKDLCGIPWRVALALQADGWWLRSDIIWAKPNPMPESVTDRPTRSHEYLFLLTKSAKYFWDAEAVREPHQTYLPSTHASTKPQKKRK